MSIDDGKKDNTSLFITNFSQMKFSSDARPWGCALIGHLFIINGPFLIEELLKKMW